MDFRAYSPGHRLSLIGVGAIVAAHVLIVGLLVVAKVPSLPVPPAALIVQIIAPQPLAVGPVIPEEKTAPPEVKPLVPPKPKPVLRRPTQPLRPKPAPVLASQASASDTMPATVSITPTEPAEQALASASEPAGSAPSSTVTAASSPVTVSPARFNADYLKNPAPVYPSLARRLGEEGKVVLRVFVDAGGRPSQIEVRTGSGSTRLDQAALDAVWRWQFVPARRGEETIAARVLVPIVFNLRN